MRLRFRRRERPAVPDGGAGPAGRVAELDRLVAAHRAAPDDAGAVRLRDLRHAVAEAATPGPGRAPWPPSHADPFPTLVGRPPEVAAGALDADLLGAAVAHHGCLLVRGLFTDDQVRRTVDTVERARAGRAGHRGDADDTVDPWYHPLHTRTAMKDRITRTMVADQGGIWLGDTPLGMEQVLADLDRAGVVAAVTDHFGERPTISLQKSTLRRSVPEYRLAAWHQDGSFLTEGVRTMNVWVALSPCGGDVPTPALEVVPRRFAEVLPVDGIMAPHAVAYELVAELAEETPTVVPQFDPGDALLFDERFLHRTHLTEQMTDVRHALECWFFAPSHPSTEYAPLLV